MTEANSSDHNIAEIIPYPPKWRLYLMRALYALTFFSLVTEFWPATFYPSGLRDTMTGVAISFWASYGFLMGFGIRYPIKMLPMIFLQLVYKAFWIIGTYLPAMSANAVDDDLQSFYWVCVTAVIIDTVAIPWGYVWKAYGKEFFNLRKTGTI